MDNNNGEALTTSQSQSVADNESDASTLKNDGDDAKGHSLAGGPFAASEGHLMQRNDTEMPTEDMPEPAASSGIEGEAQNQSDIPRNTPPPEYSGEIDSNTRCQETDSSFGQGGSNKEILASATNFWLVGSYKRVVKKIEDSSKLCDELSQMMLERSEIESLYAKKLKGAVLKISSSPNIGCPILHHTISKSFFSISETKLQKRRQAESIKL